MARTKLTRDDAARQKSELRIGCESGPPAGSMRNIEREVQASLHSLGFEECVAVSDIRRVFTKVQEECVGESKCPPMLRVGSGGAWEGR